MIMKKLIWLIILFPILFAGVEFDGVDDRINITPDNTLESAGDFTIACWIYVNSFDDDIFHRIFNYHSATKEYNLSITGTNMIADNSRTLCAGTDDINDYDAQGTANAILATTWTHICAVYNSTAHTWTLYVDNSSLGTSDVENFNYGDNGQATIGNRLLSGLPSAMFDGIINELYFWDTSLTATEVGLLVNSKIKQIGFQIQSSNLQLYLPMDDEPDGSDGNGDTYNDMSGNGNSGIGNWGGNASGLQNKAEEVLTYPGD